jgi:hypothetical protein
VYKNRFGDPNLDAAIIVEEKAEPTKVEGNTQIKSRDPDLGPPTGIAQSTNFAPLWTDQGEMVTP